MRPKCGTFRFPLKRFRCGREEKTSELLPHSGPQCCRASFSLFFSLPEAGRQPEKWAALRLAGWRRRWWWWCRVFIGPDCLLDFNASLVNRKGGGGGGRRKETAKEEWWEVIEFSLMLTLFFVCDLCWLTEYLSTGWCFRWFTVTREVWATLP